MKKTRMLSGLLVLVMVFSFVLNNPVNALAASSQITTGFNFLMGLVVNDDGSIYVAEHNGNAIKRIDTDGNSITTLGSVFNRPVSMAVSGGAIYFSEYGINKVIKMDIDGTNISEIPGTFSRPAGITLDDSGNIYVTCWNSGELKKISADESTVSTIRSGFTHPIGVAVASDGTIYVSEQHNGIYKMDSDGSNMTRILIGSFNLITLDSAGDLYATNGGTIIKIGKNNNHFVVLESIAGTAWGVTLDKDGNVYYTAEGSVYKITSSAVTTDGTHIQLTWKNSFEGTVADPEAFVVNGVASNPTVTEATVSGNRLTLTLSSPIYFNDNITLDYTATGTNDLTSIAAVGNLTNYPVNNTVTTRPAVTAVADIPDITVAMGTAQEDIGLPTTVDITLSSNAVTGAAITWDNGSPAYDSNTEGTYIFEGTITLPGDIANSGNLRASANVVVRNIINVTSIAVNGTGGATTVREGDYLQMSASVLPSDATNRAVTWSVINGTGMGTINSDGLLTGTRAGTVTVHASANDSSGVHGTKEIRITSRNTSSSPDSSNTDNITPSTPNEENGLIHIKLAQEDSKDARGQIVLPVPMEVLKARLSDSETTNVSIEIQLDEELEQSAQESGLILKAEVLEAVKASGKDLSVIIKDKDGKERYTWMFQGSNSEASDQELSDFNLHMELNTLTDEAELQETLNSGGIIGGMVFRFAHEGIIPIHARIKIYVGDQQGYTIGSRIYLYHYNPRTGKLDTLPYSSKIFVDEEGYVTADIIHCSDYVALPAEASTKMYTSLRKQIEVTALKKTLYVGDNKESSTEIKIELPPTLELVSSLKDTTSKSAIGGVMATYSSSDEKVAVVDAKGKISAVGVGKTRITTTLKLYSGKIKTVKTTITVKDLTSR